MVAQTNFASLQALPLLLSLPPLPTATPLLLLLLLDLPPFAAAYLAVRTNVARQQVLLLLLLGVLLAV